MKRALLLLAVAVFGGALLGNMVTLDPGYVLVSWRQMTLETSIWMALVLIGLIVLLLRLLWWLVGALLSGVGGVRVWNTARLQQRARRRASDGLLALAEGDWARARKELQRSSDRVDAPLLNLLGVARAAHEQGDVEARDQALREALEADPRARLAVGITRAELQLQQHQWEQALATLLELRGLAPRNARVLRMLRHAYEALQDWRALLELVGDLQHAALLPSDQVEAFKASLWRREIDRMAHVDAPQATRLAELRQLPASWPKALRRDAETVAALAAALQYLGDDDSAAELVAEQLGRHFDATLVGLYGRLAPADPALQLKRAQGWMKKHGDSVALLLAMGRMALRAGDWDQAQEYLESGLAQQRDPELCTELGRLLARRGDHGRATALLLDGVDPHRLQAMPLPGDAAGAIEGEVASVGERASGDLRQGTAGSTGAVDHASG